MLGNFKVDYYLMALHKLFYMALKQFCKNMLSHVIREGNWYQKD